jgi:transposase
LLQHGHLTSREYEYGVTFISEAYIARNWSRYFEVLRQSNTIAYKRRNLIERCVTQLKQFRRIATLYEKTARAYNSMLSIAAASFWIKTVNTA